MKTAIVNASPLIILSRAGYLDLLPKLFSHVIVPRAVVREIMAGPANDPAIGAISGADWLAVIDLAPAISPLATWRLCRGETEVLELARQTIGAWSVLDDKAARRAAVALCLPIVGTLGILVAATQAGWLTDFGIAAESAKRAGLYIDPGIVTKLAAQTRQP